MYTESLEPMPCMGQQFSLCVEPVCDCVFHFPDSRPHHLPGAPVYAFVQVQDKTTSWMEAINQICQQTFISTCIKAYDKWTGLHRHMFH